MKPLWLEIWQNQDMAGASSFPELRYWFRIAQKWWMLRRYGVVVLYPETDSIGRF